jgi:Protein of unknown function (DUF3810)
MSEATKLGQKLPWNYKRYLFALIIFVFGSSKQLITNYYLPYVYQPFSLLLRSISGKLGFAIGEWIYIIICILLIIRLIKLIRKNNAPFLSWAYWSRFIVKILNGWVKLYIVFQLFWGLNYQKQTPASDFQLNVPTRYTESQMDSLSLELIQQMNLTRASIPDARIKALKCKGILEQSMQQYGQLAKQYSFLAYHQPSLKMAAFPAWGDYFGYTAFYQPFTGEAIVRGDLPVLTLPFTVSHEIAHQLGYASETEANFIAYVIGAESKDPLFQYSTQLQLFSYAQQAQLLSIAKRGDSLQFQKVINRNKQLLSPVVIADRKQIRDFFTRKQDLQIPGSTQLYNQFLKWNQQANGVESYNDVLLWALAYAHKK